MFFNEIATSILIALGAVIMLLSVLGTRQVLGLLQESKYIQGWRILFFLMIFFLMGYGAALALVIAGVKEFLIVLTGVIFLFGALFVYLVVQMGYRTIGDLLSTTVSKEYTDNIIKSMMNALIVLTPEATIKTVNQATCNLLGYQEAELIGQPISILFAQEDNLFNRPGFEDLINRGFINNIETTYLSKEARNIPVLFSSSAIYNPDGKLQAIVCVVQDITRRKQAEKALRESEDRFRQVISSISDHVYMTELTKEGQHINRYISPNIEALTGYPLAAFMADWNFWPSILIHPQDRTAAAAQAERFAQGQNSEMEYRLIRADGKIIWVRDSGRVEQDPDSQSLLVYGVVSDITERKLAEEALLKQKIEQQIIFDSVPAMIWYKDTENRILRLNRCAAESMGRPVAEVEGKSAYELHKPQEAAQYYEDDLAVINSGEPKTGITEPLQSASGEYRWILTDKIPYRDQEGNITGIIVFALDITERKQAEEALRESEDRFRQVISSISDHIYMTEYTKEGKQINRYISPNVKALTGYPHEKFMADWNFWPSTLIHPGDRAAAAAQAKRFAQGRNSEMEYRLIRADGEIIWVRDSGRVERDPASQSILVYGLVGDITERKLAEEQLALARDRALEASRLKTQLLSNVSHDMRTPLNAIMGYAEMLQEGVYGPLSDPQQRDTVAEIIDSTGQLLNFINNLLNQAQIESGKLVLKRTPIRPAGLVEGVMSTMYLLAQTKGLALTSEIAPDLPPTCR